MREENGRLVFEDAARPPRPAAAAPARPPSASATPPPRIAALRAVAPDLPRARASSAASREARMAGAAAAAAQRPAGRPCARAAPRSGSTAAITRRAAACSPRRWPISRRQSPRPLALICGTLEHQGHRRLPAPFQGPRAGDARRADPRRTCRRARPRRSRPSPQGVGLNAAACQSVEAALRFLAARAGRRRRAS